MKRREFLGWTAAIGGPLAVMYGGDQKEQMDAIKDANTTPLTAAVEDVEVTLDETGLGFGVLPRDEGELYDAIEQELDVTYELSVDGETIDIAVDATDMDWGPAVDQRIEDAHDEAIYDDDATVYGQAIDDETTVEELQQAVRADPEARQDALRDAAAFVASYGEAMAASELKFYEDSQRMHERGLGATVFGIEASPDDTFEDYRSTLEAGLDGGDYRITHDLDTGTVQEAEGRPSFQGSVAVHLEDYRGTATVHEL